jgi:hypothetical protein
MNKDKMQKKTVYKIKTSDLETMIKQFSGDQLLSRDEAAKMVGVTPDTIDRFADAGILTRQYDSRPNISKPIVRFSKHELFTRSFTPIRKL